MEITFPRVHYRDRGTDRGTEIRRIFEVVLAVDGADFNTPEEAYLSP